MIPYSVRVANSKLDEKLRYLDILTKDRLYLDNLVWISCILHHPLNAPQKHRLYAVARLSSRQWQQYLCCNTNTDRQHEHGQQDCQRCFAYMSERLRCPGCALSECAYNNVWSNLQRVPYSAELFIRTGPRTLNGTVTRPQRQIGTPRSRTAWEDWQSNYLK